MTEAPEPSRESRIGWGRILLFASLAANLLIVGMVVGAMLRQDRAGRNAPPRPSLAELGYGPYGRALSQQDRRAIDQKMAGHADNLHASRLQMRRQIQTLLQALRTSPFDPDVVRIIVTEQQGMLLQRQEVGRQVLLGQIEAMSDAERAAFADRLQHSFRGRR